MESDICIKYLKIGSPSLFGINFIIIVLNSIFQESYASNVLRPRGVPVSKSSFYDPSKSFTCFDGSWTIPFNYINDDYCDCSDGSDEPGTSACINGVFHCNNIGHIGQDISSTFVNDGVCDCCDTSDEYASSADCLDNCYLMGEVAREEARRMAEVQYEGYNIRKKMAEEGANIKKEKQARIEELLKEKEKAQEIQAEKLSVKEAAEALEKEALEEYKAIEEEIKARQEKERKEKDENDAREAFEKLDEDNDGLITIQELQANQVFDTNRDGEVSEIEAQFYLQQKESIDLENFLISGWALMKPAYLHQKQLFTPPSPSEELPEEESGQTEEEPVDTASEKSVTEESDKEYQSEYEGQDGLEDEDGDEEDEENEDYADEVEDLEVTKAKEEGEEEEEEKEEKEDEIQYDPETQRLIDVANAARDDYKTADDQLRDIIKEIQNLQDGLTKDFGPNDEFRGFEGRCYEYSDREYVYKLCPFDSATQKQKNGHGETRLGSWGSWTGPAEDPYSIMKYTAGQGCWNGPQRSAEVRLTCGIENELTSVTEPNRCEYLFLFTTPAICNEPENSEKVHQHTEL
ncbi:UNVERIFIED_CONTAM: hypothetical protein RMT77_009947 [Armadillidium vulgare]